MSELHDALNVITRAQKHSRTLDREDDSRKHINVLLDLIAAQRGRHIEDKRLMEQLRAENEALREKPEETSHAG